MQDSFLNFVRSQQLVKEGERVLLAISGGLDSVVMCHLFSGTPYEFGVAHCNFQLRGDESEEDEKFVRSLSRGLNVPFYTQKFRTEDYSKSNGISIQMAARELRYDWVMKIAEKEGYDKIALAHHKDDQLETILFNLARGTGIAGLSGMQPQNGKVIRPLLFSDREKIQEYAQSINLEWREDSSNITLKYKRNLIRHKVVPVLKEINPRLIDTLDFTLLRLIETESALNEKLLSFMEAEVKKRGEDIYISKSALMKTVFPTIALHSIAAPFGFSYQQCVSVLESMENVGNLFYGKTGVINIDRSELILSPMDEEGFQSMVIEIEVEKRMINLDHGNLKISNLKNQDLKIKSSPNVANLDWSKLKFPLKVRHWAAGDWFIPFGMKGKKKISDLMIDEKIPLNLKSRVLVLESAGDIVWVIGHRIDDRYKINPETTTVWRAEYEEV